MTQTSLASPKDFPSPNMPQQLNLCIEDHNLPRNIKQLLNHLHQINIRSNQNGFVEDRKKPNQKHSYIQSQNQAFCVAFKRLSQLEQTQYLTSMIARLKERNSNTDEGHGFDRNQQDFTCAIRLPSSCLQIWNMISMKLNKKRRLLKILMQGKTIEIYLREYLVRRSKVHLYCFVLQNITFSTHQEYDYHIRFLQDDAKLYSYAQQQIKGLIVQVHSQALLKQIQQEQKMRQALSKGRGQLFIFLNKKNISKIDKVYEQIKSKKEMEGTQYREAVSSEKYKIEINQMDNTQYRAKYTLKEHQLNVLSNFVSIYQNNHNMITNLKILQTLDVDDKIYEAFYQKIRWNDQIYGQTLICRSQNGNNQIHNDHYGLTLVNIDHEDNHNFIESLQMQVARTSGMPEVHLYAKFTGEIMFQFGAVQAYVTQLIEVFQNRKNTIVSPKSSQQLTADTQDKQHPQLQALQSINQQGTSRSLLNPREHFQRREQATIFLKHNYQIHPSKQEGGKILKEHFLWNHWKRAQKGGLICKNKELVDKQKELFKIVLKKFGETLISGRNIINFSLPVIVFKKQSHLQSLAKTYVYSPIFAEKAAKTSNPIERMKLSVVFMITENALSIHMEKPFNPILGETYQGWVDGCPIYLQQISHHPPVSAYYIEGRGYKKYGSIEPKISVGLNNAHGYSLYPHFVQFEDGVKIEYICAKMCIGGLLVGDRTFNFADKIYAYDRKNRYFASVKFGPVQTGFFSSSNEPQDYFHGFIYEVTKQFQRYFDSEKEHKPHPQKQHIIRSVSKFDGIWNSSININGEQILNFQTDLPYEFIPEAVPLPSDSRYRKDLTQLLGGDLQAAQMAKQQMQQLQRHDRKLRENYSK